MGIIIPAVVAAFIGICLIVLLTTELIQRSTSAWVMGVILSISGAAGIVSGYYWDF